MGTRIETSEGFAEEFPPYPHHGRCRRRREALNGCRGATRADSLGLNCGGRGPRRSGMKFMELERRVLDLGL